MYTHIYISYRCQYIVRTMQIYIRLWIYVNWCVHKYACRCAYIELYFLYFYGLTLDTHHFCFPGKNVHCKNGLFEHK